MVEMAQGSFIPHLSLAERDRRHARVRAMMAEHELDCLVVASFGHMFYEHNANVTYLTHIGQNLTEAMAVFPMEGETACLLADASRARWWQNNQPWTKDVRGCGTRWSEAVAGLLKELGYESRRIGLVGLEKTLRANEGIIPHGTVVKLERELPKASFVEAAEQLQRVRSIKSAEEIECHRRAVAIAEKALEAEFASARAGVPECAVYAEMIAALVRHGGEFPPMLLWTAAAKPGRTNTFATQRPLQDSDIIVNDMVVHYCGYASKVSHPVFVGVPPSRFTELFKRAVDVFESALETMRPGIACDEIGRPAMKMLEGSGFAATAMPVRGLGLGEDIPLGGRGPEEDREKLIIQPGMVFSLQPRTVDEKGGLGLSLADTVAVDERGGYRLGTRKLELVSV